MAIKKKTKVRANSCMLLLDEFEGDAGYGKMGRLREWKKVGKRLPRKKICGK